ncbi:hypothetical protein O3M35_006618 [Rhynocoris fuscipes]|uniref:Uncharacterized protein n=1 Tax=Rhynocoris fuscipes TaxID=488301 RepID=A0AAW1DFT1_9HEMI
MWYLITKRDSERNYFSILEPKNQIHLCDTENEMNHIKEIIENTEVPDTVKSKNEIAEDDDNEFVENLELIDGNIAFKNEINKKRSIIYKFNDLILAPNKIYKDMKIRAVSTSLDTIKKMDEALWDEIRKLYEKLKLGEITFSELFIVVKKIILQIYGINEFEKILTIYDTRLSESVYQVGKYLLSTYHEAFVSVFQVDKEVQGNDRNKYVKFPAQTNNNVIKKLSTPQNSSATAKRKCLACKLKYNKQQNVKTFKRPTFQKKIIPNVVNNKTIQKTAIKTILTKTNDIKQSNPFTNLSIKAVNLSREKFSSSSNLESDDGNKDEIVDDVEIDADAEPVAVNEIVDKEVNAVLYSSQFHPTINEPSIELLSVLNKERDPPPHVDKITMIKPQRKRKPKVVKRSFKETFAKYLSTFMNSISRYTTCLMSNVQRFLPNLIIMILFSLYRNNYLTSTFKMFGITQTLKLGLRDQLQRALLLLED